MSERKIEVKSEFMSPISELIPEVVQKIGCFLEPHEAGRLSQTCTSISKDLSLSTHSSLANGKIESMMTLRGGQQEGNKPICIGAIVPQYEQSFHSVTLKFNWKDQGRGRRKGRLFVVAQKIPKDLDALSGDFGQSLRDLRFKKKRIVYRSPFAHHRTSSLQVPICPKPNKIYQIWCKVGPASSFSLSLKDISIYMTAFGNRVPTCAFYQFQQKRIPPQPMPVIPQIPIISQHRRMERRVGFWWALHPEPEPTDFDEPDHFEIVR